MKTLVNYLSALAVSMLLLATGAANAQVANLALSLGANDSVDFGLVSALDNKDSFSIQFWFNPVEWNPGAFILKRGDNFSISLAEPGNIHISSSGKDILVPSPLFSPGVWNQLTIICDNGEASVLVNGEKSAEGSLNPLEKTSDHFVLGDGYSGLIDEVRLWNAPLGEEMKTFDYFVNNTLTKWVPQWSDLIAYYKMDMEDAHEILDYKFLESPAENTEPINGSMSDGTKRVLAQNPGLPYLINGAYTNNAKFFEAAIPREQYLLANNLIILGTDTFAEDGHIETKTPNNHALKFLDVSILDEFNGHKGVAMFDGSPDSYIILPGETLKPDGDFTFETWLFLDKINPEFSLFRRGNDNYPEETSLSIIQTEEKTLARLLCNGLIYETDSLPFEPNEWLHFALSYSDGSPEFFINGNSFLPTRVLSDNRPHRMHAPEQNPAKVYLGENLAGNLDETLFWKRAFNAQDIAAHMQNPPMPAIGKSVPREVMQDASALYRFDNPENPGHSSHSQDEWLNIMKGAYEGYDGISYHISVQGTYKVREKYGDWREILYSPEKRARFASDLAEISGPYDGVELDLEWLEDLEQWHLFGILAKEIRAALPEGKDFRISLHNNYTAFPPENIGDVDGFTFQQYGPNPRNFSYQDFLAKVDKFTNKYPKEKILTSYATTTSKGTDGVPVNGVRTFMEVYEANDLDTDTGTIGEITWSFIGPMQVFRRARHTRQQGLAGIFYWDMANDAPLPDFHNRELPSPVPYNNALFSTFAISPNLQPHL